MTEETYITDSTQDETDIEYWPLNKFSPLVLQTYAYLSLYGESKKESDSPHSKIRQHVGSADSEYYYAVAKALVSRLSLIVNVEEVDFGSKIDFRERLMLPDFYSHLDSGQYAPLELIGRRWGVTRDRARSLRNSAHRKVRIFFTGIPVVDYLTLKDFINLCLNEVLEEVDELGVSCEYFGLPHQELRQWHLFIEEGFLDLNYVRAFDYIQSMEDYAYYIYVIRRVIHDYNKGNFSLDKLIEYVNAYNRLIEDRYN